MHRKTGTLTSAEITLARSLDPAGVAAARPARLGAVAAALGGGCHGDLTLRNICLFEGVPTPFDALEFDERLATIDVLYDLAFALMDLWHRGRPDLANLLFNRYLDGTGEAPDAGLMPFLMGLRAVICAHVTASQMTARRSTGTAGPAFRAEAQAYLALAGDLLVERPACLMAIGGLSGSGKSTLAAALAHRIGASPGARIVGSDRTRKRLHGVVPQTRLPPDAYAAAVSEQVYAAMRSEAARVLAGGASVILDAVFARPAEREAAESLAAACGATFEGLWLEAPLATLTERVVAWRGDPSDATPAILAAQARRDRGTITWHRLDAGLVPETLAEAACQIVLPAVDAEGAPAVDVVRDHASA